MSDVLKIVETQFVATDKSTATLQRLEKSATALDDRFNRITNGLMMAGGLAGAFGLVQTVRGVEDTYKAVARIKTITGETAENSHALLDAMEMNGIEAGSAEQSILGMARKLADVERGMAGGAEQAQEMARTYKRLGVDMKAGPVQTMEQMAKAAHDGKLQVTDTMKLFGVGKSHAVQLNKMLEKGPEAFRKDFEAGLESADLITTQALRNFEKLSRARREMNDAWSGLVGTVYKALAPALTKLIDNITKRLQEWEPAAQRFADVIVNNMDRIVAGAKLVAKLMVAQKAVGMLGGGGIAQSIGRFAGGGALLPKVGAFAGQAGAIIKVVTSLSGLLRLSVLGLIIAVIAGMLKAAQKHAELLKSTFSAFFTAVGGLLSHLWDALGPLLGLVGKLAAAIGEGLMGALILVLKVVTAIAEGAVGMIDRVRGHHKFKDMFTDSQGNKLGEDWASRIMDPRGLAKQQAERDALADKQRPEIYQDFRGSKFDIKQDFAEGFDPDRVAVAFTGDLAALGERQVQSGFAPLFSVR